LNQSYFWSIILLLFSGWSLQAQNPGDHIFDQPKIIDFYFYFDQDEYLDSLYNSQGTGEYIPADVKIEGIFYDEIGVRFKGFSSFWGYPGDKKSLRIKFNKFNDHRFDGLKKINLNNGWNDPSMLREKLFLDFLYDQKIPAPRANFARVFLNDRYWGFYTLVEHVDKTFLQTRFYENEGNLYKAEKLADLNWKGNEQEKYYENFALKTNEKENNWQDLLQFLELLNKTSDEHLKDSLELKLNTQDYIRGWAANNLFVNLDSYLSSATNYYLYHYLPDERFEWIIWDVNLAFAARGRSADLEIFDDSAPHPLITRMLKNAFYKSEYLRNIREFLVSGFTQDSLFSRIDLLTDLIREPFLADTLKMYTNEQIISSNDQPVENVPGLKSFIIERRKNVLRQLDSLTTTNISEIKNVIHSPDQITLYPNYPNPFNPITYLNFNMTYSSSLQIEIFNNRGQRVRVLQKGNMPAGEHKVLFNANGLSGGVYLYRISTDFDSVSGKIILLK
jgi:hypothetical protein